jgi:hypothetical protein
MKMSDLLTKSGNSEYEQFIDEESNDKEVFRVYRNDPTLANRIIEALDVIWQFSQISGEHHKAWCIDRVTRILTGDEYYDFVDAYCHPDGAADTETYSWDCGIEP